MVIFMHRALRLSYQKSQMQPATMQLGIQGSGPVPSPLFVDQNEPKGLEKFFWETGPPLISGYG